MVEASFKAFARALRAAVDDRARRDRTSRPRRACCEVARSRPRLRHGQPALGARRRSSTSAPSVEVTRDADAHPRGRRPRAARRRRVPEGDGGGPRARLRRSSCASTSTPAGPCSASAWACSSCSSRARELGGAKGLGLLDGEVAALDAPGLKVPHIGWNEVAWTNGTPLTEGLANPAAFYHVHSFAPRPGARRRRARHGPRTAREFATAVGRGKRLRRAVPPGEVGPATGSRCCGTSRASRRDPPAGDRHPRRQGGAAASRATSTRRRSTSTTRSRPRARGSRPARASCTWSTSTARARASRRTSTTCERITVRADRAGPVRRRAARRRGRARRARRRRGPRDPRHGRLQRRRVPRRVRRELGRRAWSWRSTCAAGTCRWPAGRRRRRCCPRT